MEWIAVLYSLGVIVSLLVYRKFYHMTIPLFEIAVTWYYQLPMMIIQHRQHVKAENEILQKKADAWSVEFRKALKEAEIENWSKADWDRWHSNADYVTSLIVR